jgi:hypothetical protein
MTILENYKNINKFVNHSIYKDKAHLNYSLACGILNPTLEQKEIWYMMLGVLLVMGIYTYIIR